MCNRRLKISIKCLKQLSRLKNYKIHTERVLLLFVTASCSGVHYIWVMILLNFQEHQKSINFQQKLQRQNEQHFHILKVLFLCGILGGMYFNTRLNWKRALFRSKTACRASSPSAAGGRCSEARMAQRSKYGVTPPYFGHRKRGCEATSSPFVYHKQSCGDNYCFCFTAIGVLSE